MLQYFQNEVKPTQTHIKRYELTYKCIYCMCLLIKVTEWHRGKFMHVYDEMIESVCMIPKKSFFKAKVKFTILLYKMRIKVSCQF